jgi:hypothetical protein
MILAVAEMLGRMPVDFVAETHRRLGIVCISSTGVFDSHRIMSILMISISILQLYCLLIVTSSTRSSISSYRSSTSSRSSYGSSTCSKSSCPTSSIRF